MEKKQFIKMSIRGLFIIIVATLFVFGNNSCKKGQNCLTNTGKIVTNVREVADFDSIYLNDNVTLILKQDSENHVAVEAGENIISGITTEVNGGQLIIHNCNSCNWLRDYNTPVNVYVSYSSEKPCLYLYYNSSGNVTTTNLIVNDTIEIHTWGGCGTINMIINCRKGIFVQHMGTVNFLLQGICDESNIYAGDYGLFECRKLKTGFTFIKNYGTNNCYIQAKYTLNATVGSIGNIYYVNDPPPDRVIKFPQGTDQILPIGDK